MKEHIVAKSLPWRSELASPEALKDVVVELKSSLEERNVRLCMGACRKLTVYLNLRGQLTLEDRENLVDVLYQWMFLDSVTTYTQIKLMKTISSLLEKRHVGLTVSVQWKTLWELVQKVHFRKDSVGEVASSKVRSTHARELATLCKHTRKYFSDAVFEEVCEEAYKYLKDCLKREMFKGQAVLVLFLPSCSSAKFAPHLERWVREEWDKIENCPEWESSWLYLAKRALKWGGNKDISDKLLSSLNRKILGGLAFGSPSGFAIPARTNRPSYLNAFAPRTSGAYYAAKVSILLIGVGSAESFFKVPEGFDRMTSNSLEELEECLSSSKNLSAGMIELRRLLSSVQTLFHPSNSSRHSGSVAVFAETLTTSFAKRLGRERVDDAFKSTGRMTHHDKKALVDTLIPLITMALYSKVRSVQHSAQAALGHLAYVAPISVSKHFFPLIGEALDPNNLNQTHQAPAAIRMLTVLVQPLLQVKPLLAENLAELLELTLPGIDPNDVTKTMTTCMLYQVVLSWVPIIDVEKLSFPSETTFPSHDLSFSQSYGVDDPADEDAYDEAPLRDAMWRTAPVLVDWSIECLNRILSFVNNQVQRAKGGLAEQLDNAVYSSMALTARLLLSQMSPPVLRKAAERLNEWALNSVNLDAIRESKSTIRSYATCMMGSQSDETVKELVMVGLFEPLLAQALNKDTSIHKMEWSLVLLGAIARVTGPHLPQYEKDLMKVVEVALDHEEAKIRKLGGKILRRSMRGATEQYIPSRASHPALEERKPQSLALAAVSWGQPVSWEETCTEVTWHRPTKDELAFAARLRDKFLKSSLDELETAMESGKSSTVLRSKLEVVFQVVRGMACFTTERSERSPVLEKICNSIVWLLKNRESDTVSHRRAIKIMQSLLCCYGANTAAQSKLKGRKLWFRYMREAITSKAYIAELRAAVKHDLVENRKDWVVPRFHQVDDVQSLFQLQLHELSFVQAREAKDSKEEGPLEFCFDTLQIANSHDWADTRKAAQEAIKDLVSKSPWYGKARTDSIIDRLVADDDKAHGKVLGAAKMIEWNKILRWVAGDWYLLDRFTRAILFDVSDGIKKLPDDKQKEVNEAVQKLYIQVLAAWTGLPSSDQREHESIRVNLMKDITDPSKTSGFSWRQQIIVCVMLQALAHHDSDSTIDSSMLQWVFNRIFSDMLPLRTAALSVLVQLLARVPVKKQDVMIKQLDLDSGEGDSSFFRLVADALAQDHGNASVSVDGNTKGLKQRADWSNGVGELLKLCKFPGSSFYPDTIVPSHSKDFSTSHKLLIEHLTNLLGPERAYKSFLPHLKHFLFENEHLAEHQSKVSAAAEIFSGILSAGINKPLIEVVNEKIYDSSLETADVWFDAYRLCSDKAAQEYALKLFVSKLEAALADRGNMSKAVLACNIFRLVRVLCYELPPDQTSGVLQECVSISLNALDHPYENVRRELARALAAIIDSEERFTQPGGAKKKWVSEVLGSLKSSAIGRSREKEVSGDTCTVETVLNVAASIMLNGGMAREKYSVDLLPAVFEAQGHPNIDVSKLAKSTAACLSSGQFFSQRAVIEFTNEIADVGLNQTENWYARQMVSLMLSSLLVANSSMLGYAVGLVHCRKEVEKLLRDSQVEVQNSASTVLTEVLSGFIHTSPSLTVTKERYLKLAKSKLRKDQYKTEEGKEKLKKRMTGVLGLAALVHAFPYTVPFPDAVVALAKRVSDPSPVGPSAKQAVQMFKHTHTDSWQEAKTHFTSEELEDLQDSSYSGSHA